MTRRWTFVVAAALVGALSCSKEPTVETKTIVLGAVIDQSSSMAWSTWTTVGNLAVTQLNSALEKANSNTRFQLTVGDSAADPTTTITRATDLVKNKAAKAIITDNSNNDVALAKLQYDADTANDLAVPLMCITCTSASINNPAATDADAVKQAALRDVDNWNWRTCTRQTEQLTVLKSAVTTRGDANTDGTFKVSVIVLDDSSGHPFVQSILKMFSEGNPNVVVEKITLSSSNHDLNDTAYWDTQAARLIDAKTECKQDATTAANCAATDVTDVVPDALMENLNPGYNIALSQALARANNTVAFFHAHAFRANQVAETLRSAINGQKGVSPVLYENNDSGKKFADDLKSSSGLGPTLLDSAMYDATIALGLAALKASKGMGDPSAVTGAQVREALGQLNDPAGQTVRTGVDELKKAVDYITAGTAINYDGASGPVDFDANGSVFQRLSLYEGQSGAFVDVAKYDCVGSTTCPVMP